ncbi:BB0821 family autotransporter [Bordetella bronchiseptica]|uniref:BB0821 family autotransporter n=1 Tax=Bordetella bronchiseptica TaxID=518 RepID=UPI003F742C24
MLRHLGWLMAGCAASAYATDYPALNLNPGDDFTLQGGDTVTGATAVRMGSATLNFDAGPIAVDAASTGIFTTNGTGALINFLPGSVVTLDVASPTAGVGISTSPNSNTVIDLQANSSLTINAYQGISLSHTPQATPNRLNIGDGATLRVNASGTGLAPKGMRVNNNNSVVVASGGTLDLRTTGGSYARALELSVSLTYPDAAADKFTAAPGSNLNLSTTGQDSDAFYMLGVGEALMQGNTDIHTTGANSTGFYLYRYGAPTSHLLVSPHAGGHAAILTEGQGSHGLWAINGSRAEFANASLQTRGDEAAGLYALTTIGETATQVQAADTAIATAGAQSYGVLAQGYGTRVALTRGTVDTSGAQAHAVVVAGESTFSADGTAIQAQGDGAMALLMSSDRDAQTATVSGGSLRSLRGSAIGIEGGTARVELDGTTVDGAINWLHVADSGALATLRDVTVPGRDPSQTDAPAFPAILHGTRAAGIAATATVVARNADLTGAAITEPGNTSHVTLIDTTWHMTGSSTITNLVNDPSLIDFAAPQGGAYKTLTVGNYSGDGTIALNTYLGADDSPSDKLVIDGGGASGTSKLRIKNTGGPGAATQAQGILVVDTINGGTTTAGAFSLAEPVVVGAYDYQLYRGAQTPEQEQNWYLRSAILPPVDPTNPDQPGEPIPTYRPETPGAVMAPEVARQVGARMLDTFHDRMGDQYALLNSAQRKAGWGRVIGQRLTQRWDGDVEPRFKGNIWIAQAGADMLERERDDGLSDRLGLFGAYGQADGRVDGFVQGQHGKQAGKLRVEAYGLGLYWTRLKQTNWYWDNVLMGNYYTGRSRSDRGVAASLEGWGLTASSEAGYSFFPRHDIMLQPQAQLVYQYTSLDDTHDAYSTIRYHGGGALTGRIGLLLQGNADQPEKIRPYARINLWHRFSHGESVSFGPSDSIRTEYGSTSLDLRIGLAAPLNRQTELYASAGYGFDLDGNQRQAYYGNIGVRYSW